MFAGTIAEPSLSKGFNTDRSLFIYFHRGTKKGGTRNIVDWEKEDTEIVKKVFGAQRIELPQFTTLTDAKLKKYGLIQGGLREAVLAVI